jgi:hypothetical protein|tara:strand:- start:1708 stop:3153 length:1446 start_codon:yes stop_codon:yes gene_type:complete
MLEKENKAPINYEDWIDSGRIIIPCIKGLPEVKKWSDPKFKISKEEWKNKYSHCEIALRLDQDIDLDIDNPLAKRFIKQYVKECGAISGRGANPWSHYWWKGKTQFTQFKLPSELKEYYKTLPHGAMICELRSGNNKYTIVPESQHSKANEIVKWEKYSGINEYTGDLRGDVGKVALSTALCLLYAPTGQRDDYCTAMAGVLIKHTNWEIAEIDEFVFNVAVQANDDEANKRMSKGTSGKKANKNLGIPKLAEIIGCSNNAVSEIFSWVGVKHIAGKEIAQESIGDIVEYGSDRYIINVNAQVDGEMVEKKITVDGPTLMNQKAFYDAIITQASVWVPKMKPSDFEIIMRKKYELRKRSADYVKEAAEDYRFLKHFKNYITQVKAYTDKKELFEYGFPYYNTQAHTLEFKLDKFEDYLEQKKANFKDRVDLVMKAQTILKAKRTNGKYKGKSCVSWKIEEKDIKQEDLIVEGEFKELTNDS